MVLIKDVGSEKDKKLSVSEYIKLLNNSLSNLYGEVIGEISEITISAKGHVYFVLKDKITGYVLPCTIWETNYLLNGIDMEIGMEILIKGRPEFYGPFGKLSFITKNVELVGDGALKKAYEKLKEKLEKEGLFDNSRKKTLPLFPKKIAVITSNYGAVIHDFTNNLRKSGFQIKILDCRVEGSESGPELALSVRALRGEDIDLLVIIRGGGSIQSLAGFNNEALVREIANFPTPVIIGVGHHEDVTLASLVADASESTPSLTAELIGRSWEKAEQSVDNIQRKIFSHYEYSLERSSKILRLTFEKAKKSFDKILKIHDNTKQSLRHGMQKIKEKIKETQNGVSDKKIYITQQFQKSIDEVNNKCLFNIPKFILKKYTKIIKDKQDSLKTLKKLIETNNPERQLELGY
ncbi:MAG: exodeoxyribonuclease VII large subunit, partial [Candidatus Magasanikbacteria bacterium CG_4_9_14_3_um_filter_32_9]